MVRFVKITLVLIICATITFASPVDLEEEEDFSELNVEVRFVNHISDWESHWNLIKLNKTESLQKTAFRYTLGGRVNGDRLVAQGSNRHGYPTSQNVQLMLQYPTSGIGAIVTFVDVIVEQSSNLGDGYVLAGGIGQRKIAILIEAKSTTYLNYAANIYGV